MFSGPAYRLPRADRGASERFLAGATGLGISTAAKLSRSPLNEPCRTRPASVLER